MFQTSFLLVKLRQFKSNQLDFAQKLCTSSHSLDFFELERSVFLFEMQLNDEQVEQLPVVGNVIESAPHSFTLLEAIGDGGYGSVFLASDSENRKWAVKVEKYKGSMLHIEVNVLRAVNGAKCRHFCQMGSNSTLPPTVPTNESFADTSAEVQGKETASVQAEEGLIDDDVPDTHDRTYISKSSAASPVKEEALRNAEGKNEELKKDPVQMDDIEHDKPEKKQVVRKKNKKMKKQHECSVCGRTLSRSCALTVHMRTHTGEKPYECDLCQMRFADSSHLHRHKKNHTGEKLFRCDVCEKKFAPSDTLLYHRRTHTGVLAHEYNVCGRRFGEPSYLFAHKRIHIRGKPYACDVCDFKSSNMVNLKMHKRTHTKDGLKK